MSLERLERQLPLFRLLAGRAAACTKQLESAVMLDAIASYAAQRTSRPELSPDACFRMRFEAEPKLGRLVLAWTDVIEPVLTTMSNKLHEAARTQGGAEVEDRYLGSMLFIAETVSRPKIEGTSLLAAQIAIGEITLDAALDALDPNAISAQFTAGPEAAAKGRRPLAATFAELEAHAARSGLVLQVMPLLAAARTCAESIVTDPKLPDRERISRVLAEGDPLRSEFSAWFSMARQVVEDTDDHLAGAPKLRERYLDVMLYLLELSTRDTGDAPASITDGILAGRVSLADALAR